MNLAWTFLLGNGLVAVVLALLACAARRLGASPRLVHAMWLLVLIKLITPPLIPLTLPQPGEPAAELAGVPPESTRAMSPATRTVAPRLGTDEVTPPASVDSIPVQVAEPVSASRARESVTPDGERATSFFLIEASPALFVLWLLGAVVACFLIVLRITRFRRLLSLAHPAPGALTRQVGMLARHVGVAPSPRTVLLAAPISPLVWGLGRLLRLVLPSTLLERLGPKERESLITHELVHLRRRDHWVRILELVVGVLYWWHPVVWWARRALRQVEEESCDAQVIELLPDHGRSYATALVNTIEFLSHEHRSLPLAASGLGSVRNLSRRLTMILRPSPIHRPSRVGRVLAVTLALVALPIVPSLTEVQAEPESALGVEARIAALDAELAMLAPELAALTSTTPAQQDDELEAKRRQIEHELEKLDARRLEIQERRLHQELEVMAARRESLEAELIGIELRKRETQDKINLHQAEYRERVKAADAIGDQRDRERALEALDSESADMRVRFQQQHDELDAAWQDLRAELAYLERHREQLEIEYRERQATVEGERLDREMADLMNERARLSDLSTFESQKQQQGQESKVRRRALEMELQHLQEAYSRREQQLEQRLQLEVQASEDRMSVQRNGLERKLRAELSSSPNDVSELERMLALAVERGRKEEIEELKVALDVAKTRLDQMMQERHRLFDLERQTLEEELALTRRNAERAHVLAREELETEHQERMNALEAELYALSGEAPEEKRRGPGRTDQYVAQLRELTQELQLATRDGRGAESEALAARIAEIAQMLNHQREQLESTGERLHDETVRLHDDQRQRIQVLESKVDNILSELTLLRKQLSDRKLD